MWSGLRQFLPALPFLYKQLQVSLRFIDTAYLLCECGRQGWGILHLPRFITFQTDFIFQLVQRHP